jgi:hypothetical protein
MPDFSIITASPQIRAVVQENLLEKAFHDGLFPRQLYRGECMVQAWPVGAGDTLVFTGKGLIEPDARPAVPQTDPTPVTFAIEQWTAKINQYYSTIDTYMPNSMVAIANLFLQNAQQLGMQAGQTLNRIVRNRLFGGALSGWTTASAATVAVVTLPVQRLNGFTRARNPNLPAGSNVRFDLVSVTNPLAITIDGVGARNVVGFTPDTAGDESGPGTLILDVAASAGANTPVYSVDRTFIVRSGGGNSIESIAAGDLPTLADVRAAVANFWSNNVPEHPDMRFHAQIGPISQNLIFADDEFQRLMTALPDYYAYKQFALGEMLNTVFLRNSESPRTSTVVGGLTYDQRDPFPGVLQNTTAVNIERILFTAQGGIFEYYADYSALVTDAGITGALAEPSITNNGIEINTDRIQMIIAAPTNRTQDLVRTTWRFMGDWPLRTDAATGDTARYKREMCIEHAGS